MDYDILEDKPGQELFFSLAPLHRARIALAWISGSLPLTFGALFLFYLPNLITTSAWQENLTSFFLPLLALGAFAISLALGIWRYCRQRLVLFSRRQKQAVVIERGLLSEEVSREISFDEVEGLTVRPLHRREVGLWQWLFRALLGLGHVLSLRLTDGSEEAVALAYRARELHQLENKVGAILGLRP